MVSCDGSIANEDPEIEDPLENENPLAKRTIKNGLVLSFHKWRGVLQTKTLAIQKFAN